MWVSIGNMFYNCMENMKRFICHYIYAIPYTIMNNIDNSRFVINKEDYFNVFRFSRVIL